jgi:hypothetical protein
LSQHQLAFVTISCDNPDCTREVTFQANEQGKTEAFEDNPWLNSLRVVGTADQRQLSYCSDECEAKGLGSGAHNKPERKRVITGVNQAHVNLAAQAAEQARTATKAMREGSPVTLS